MIHSCSRGTAGGCAGCWQRYHPERVQTQRALPAESHLWKLYVLSRGSAQSLPAPGGAGVLPSKKKGGKGRLNTGLPSSFHRLSTTAQVPTAFPERPSGFCLREAEEDVEDAAQRQEDAEGLLVSSTHRASPGSGMPQPNALWMWHLLGRGEL